MCGVSNVVSPSGVPIDYYLRSDATGPMVLDILDASGTVLYSFTNGSLAQSTGGRDGDWVHAYLHRKEGDKMNAGYWYSRAGRPAETGDLAAEWEAIVRELLKGTPPTAD